MPFKEPDPEPIRAAPANLDTTVPVRRKPLPAPRPGLPCPQANSLTPPAEMELPNKGFSGFHFEKCLTRGQLAELWKVTDPEGQPRLLSFPAGVNDNGNSDETEAIRFLEALRHPGLLYTQVVRNSTGRVAFVSAPVEGTLADRLRHCQKLGLPGIPRRELLDYLKTAAVTLDGLHQQRQLQHLFLNPRNLLIDGRELLIADIGLAQLFWMPGGQPVVPLNGCYAAPELLAGAPSATSDQFSLAVIFQEMLTGTSPFRGASKRDRSRANLDLLPASDREPISRALLADPEKRFPSCRALIDAIDEGAMAAVGRRRTASILAPVILTSSSTRLAPNPLPTPIEVVMQMLDRAAGAMRLQQSDMLRYVLEPGSQLRHTCGAHLSPTMARLKLDGFRKHWGGELLHESRSAFVLHVPLAGSFWQRCLGRQPVAEIQLRLEPPVGENEVLTAVHVEFRPIRCDPDQACAFLTRAAPQLLDSLRTFLHVEPERRRSGRLAIAHRVGLFPVLEETIGEAVVCEGRDISLGGIGVFAPRVPPGPFVYVQSPLTPHPSAVAVLARIVRSVQQSDGLCDIGVLFAQGPETLFRAE
jgi:serine/threonine protein kinase